MTLRAAPPVTGEAPTTPRGAAWPGTGWPRRVVAPGTAVVYLSLLVLIPIAALSRRRLPRWLVGLLGRRCATPSPGRRSSSRVLSALVVVVVNTVAGTAIAWVLVRDQFAGQARRRRRWSTSRSRCRRSSPA